VVSMTRRPPVSPLFPYTTLFRSYAARSTRASSRGRPRTWSPIGSPAPLKPHGTETPGIPDRLPGIVKTSLRYMDSGSGLPIGLRSEEHTSELQSRGQLVCRLLLE